ncbi:hypothetical protein KW805_04715 [Candidatus Pacearchaeota archaeon]|nr:hypothetical protein [Candidatus Pacearchaeota archaeon]
MELVAFIGEDKEHWGQISALVKKMDSDRVILVKNRNAGDFPVSVNTEIVEIDSERPMGELKEFILEAMKKKLHGDFEVALSLASGNGKEHMALISALLSVPVGIRLVVYTKEGVEFIN